MEGTSDKTDTPLEHYNVAKPTSVCVLCYREETTMRSTATLGPSATKSPVRRKRCNFVSSFSSPERERETIREQVSVYVLSFFKRPRGKSSNQTSSSFSPEQMLWSELVVSLSLGLFCCLFLQVSLMSWFNHLYNHSWNWNHDTHHSLCAIRFSS